MMTKNEHEEIGPRQAFRGLVTWSKRNLADLGARLRPAPVATPVDDAAAEARRKFFEGREGNRYWWYRKTNHAYSPDCYSSLSNEEWRTLRDWFVTTDEDGLVGECSVPAIGWLTSLINSNNVSRVVQLGTYAGYSTLLIGWTLRRMGKVHGLMAVDIDPTVSSFTQTWMSKAGIDQQATMVVTDSAAPTLPERAREYLGGAPQLVFIDSSHQYAHTLQELDVWYDALPTGGIIAMHDTSAFAASFDSSGNGGVRRALTEWKQRRGIAAFDLSYDDEVLRTNQEVYLDGCGLGFIVKNS